MAAERRSEAATWPHSAMLAVDCDANREWRMHFARNAFDCVPYIVVSGLMMINMMMRARLCRALPFVNLDAGKEASKKNEKSRKKTDVKYYIKIQTKIETIRVYAYQIVGGNIDDDDDDKGKLLGMEWNGIAFEHISDVY